MIAFVLLIVLAVVGGAFIVYWAFQFAAFVIAVMRWR